MIEVGYTMEINLRLIKRFGGLVDEKSVSRGVKNH